MRACVRVSVCLCVSVWCVFVVVVVVVVVFFWGGKQF